jgi:hypothetical protein
LLLLSVLRWFLTVTADAPVIDTSCLSIVKILSLYL